MKADVRSALTELEQVDPAGGFDPASWVNSADGREVYNRILAAPQTVRRTAGYRSAQTRRRTAVAILWAAALLMTTFLIVGDRDRTNDPADLGAVESVASANEVLRLASAGAAKRPQLAPGPGEYIYRKTVHSDLTTAVANDTSEGEPKPFWSQLVRETSEVWIAADGSGLLRRVTLGTEFLGPRDRERCLAQVSFDCTAKHLVRSQDIDLTAGDYSLARLGSGIPFAELTTDPDALEILVDEAAADFANPPDQMFTIISDLLRSPLVSPQLQSAIYEVAARIPGIRLIGEVEDPLGRPGTAVTLDTRGQASPGPEAVPPTQRRELIFDPRSGRFLAERTVALTELEFADAGPGDVIGYAAYEEKAIVPSIGVRPER